MSPIYIHYGNDHIDTSYKYNRFFPHLRNKPDVGLWASRIDAKFGWVDWCYDAEYDTNLSTWCTFTLDDSANILEIHSEEDILPYIIEDPRYKSFKRTLTDSTDTIKWYQLMKLYDGVELFQSDNWKLHDGVFNTWDCDSIVIWNLTKIIPNEAVNDKIK